ncbi:TolC family protein, partial [Janthinobacterium sp.]|uniref:TolC family protein n=1 Tax=Janthinobacterium sp. TaxID=1871054 RepID=UPI00293DA076
MSASPSKFKNVAALMASIVLWCAATPAQAWPLKMSGEITTPFSDPLDTRPAQLDIGKALPGDKTSMSCAPSEGAGQRPSADVSNILNNLTLTQAVDLALCNNPQVKSTWAAIKVQSAGLGEARAAYLPMVNLGANQIRDRVWYPNAAQPAPAATVLAGLTVNTSLSWRLLDFGGRAASAVS